MAKKGTSSVMKRLFLLFLALVIVVYAVVVGFFIRYVQQQRSVEMSGQRTRVSNSASVIEQQIRAIANVQTQLLNDTRIKRLSMGLYSDDYERTQLILALLTTIQDTQSINSMIDDIRLSFPFEGVELSAGDGYQRRDYTVEDLYAQSDVATGQLSIQDGQLEMKVAYPLKNSVDQSYIPDYEIRITLSDRYLNDFLENFRHENMEGAFWVYDTGTVRVPLYTEDASELALLDHWDTDWIKEEKPQLYADQHDCGEGEYLFITESLQDHPLVLVTYQNTGALAWNLSGSLIQMSLVIVGMGLLCGVIVVWANHAVNKPIRKIMDAFQKVQSGDMEVRIYHQANDEFGYIYDSFNKTVSKIGSLIQNVKEQKDLLQNAELMQLQSQINPHFLYNSFYNIKFMAQNEDYEQIETFVTALAKYYRFINKETNLEVDLSSEVAHMENYIEIQQMRFGDKITVEREPLPPEAASFRVPKLILQPIIENAYNYGLKNKLEGGLLWIRYRTDANFLLIEIEDNGGSLTQQKLEDMRLQMQTFEGDARNHALTNIHRRLMLSYGKQCGLTLQLGEEKGLKVILRLDTSVQL
ncbi:MAG: sensor histidine kinase [Faecousia sp.]